MASRVLGWWSGRRERQRQAALDRTFRDAQEAEDARPGGDAGLDGRSGEVASHVPDTGGGARGGLGPPGGVMGPPGGG